MNIAADRQGESSRGEKNKQVAVEEQVLHVERGRSDAVQIGTVRGEDVV